MVVISYSSPFIELIIILLSFQNLLLLLLSSSFSFHVLEEDEGRTKSIAVCVVKGKEGGS